jgi:Bacterial extracellular solute-binding protein
MYVARGEAALGIVYATDAAMEPRVKVLDLFPESSHPPITYPVALTSAAKAGTAAYLKFLRGPEAAAIFSKAGFKVLSRAASSARACAGFQFDVSKELNLLSGASRDISAATVSANAPTIELNRPYQVSLSNQDQVKFAAPPGKRTANEGSYAGVVRLSPGSARTLRISLNETAWIDVIDGKRAVESTRHTGSHDCAALRKSVEFKVTPNRPLLIQVSGSTEKDVRLIVS